MLLIVVISKYYHYCDDDNMIISTHSPIEFTYSDSRVNVVEVGLLGLVRMTMMMTMMSNVCKRGWLCGWMDGVRVVYHAHPLHGVCLCMLTKTLVYDISLILIFHANELDN